MKKLFIICLSLFCYQFLFGQLYPGRGSNQGEAGGQGNQGVTTGAPDVHVYGEGDNISGGNKFALSGRNLVGQLPIPAYNVQDQGAVTVVVAITVDKEGNVTKATPGAKGTTTLDKTLLDAAEKAARQAKFSRKPDAIEQTGTITYIFKSADSSTPGGRASDYDVKYPINAAGERTIFKGPTTVSYELSGRHHVWMPAPVFKCRKSGTVVVNIVVNGNGNVLSAEINKSKSSSDDPCIIEAAVRDAERSRFNESTTDRQQGAITYIFKLQE